MRMYDIIHKKRNGSALSDSEISFFIKGYTSGEIPDYQAAALCMAIYFNGMTDKETVTLTQCMANSGDTVDLSRFGALSADKHSTGGVGDKTTLIVAPTVASLGGIVTKMSGRGLGHTGGTVDKLESIPGFRTELSPEEFMAQAEKVGIAVVGQTGTLAPADKKLYALRDVTATVDSIPLITASIMSKKLAAGSKNIVLDVKYGSGAFMKTPGDATVLAENMVRIGKDCGRNTAAVITNMNMPLGSSIGNALEVKEAVAVLRGEKKNDLRDVCVTLASELTAMVRGTDVPEAKRLVESALGSGAAYEKFKEWISAQGGDVRAVEDVSLLPQAKYIVPVRARESGFIGRTDAEKVGLASVALGAGRKTKGDSIDMSAGIVMEKKTGDRVEKGEVICFLHTNSPDSAEDAARAVSEAFDISPERPPAEPLIYKTIR